MQRTLVNESFMSIRYDGTSQDPVKLLSETGTSYRMIECISNVLGKENNSATGFTT
jgi:hypothetical protein